MDTTVTITVYHQNPEVAKQLVEDTFTEIQSLEKVFSIYDNQSQAYLLNRQGYLENPDRRLVYILEQSSHYSQVSGGAFDITVQPILDLYSHTFGELGRPPTSEEVNETLRLLGYEKIMLNDSGIYLAPGMKLTFGAIAKGYIIDRAIAELWENGVEHALVDAGGDMRAIGARPDGPWGIALQNPRNQTEYLAVIHLEDKAVATSGDYERYYVDKSAHHIVNPKTGYSSRGVMSAIVVASTATQADALSTTIMVLGVNEGMTLIESIDGVEALIIDEDKRIHSSSGWTY